MRRFLKIFSVFMLFTLGLGATFAQAPVPANHIRIHYHRNDGNYTGWTVYAFGDTTEDTGNFGGGPVQISGTDSYGAYFDVGITANAMDVGIIVHNGDTKDPGPDEHVDPATQGNQFYQLSGTVGLTTTPIGSQKNPNIPANTARIHYDRPDGVYANWTVYAFKDTTADTGNYNGGPIQPTGTDSYGVYFDVPLTATAQDLGFIVHNISTGVKNTTADLDLNVAVYNEAWIVYADPTVYLTPPTTAQLLNGNFLKSQAYWIDRSTVAIPQGYSISGATYALISDGGAHLALTSTAVTGGVQVPLTAGGTLSAAQTARFPMLAAGYVALSLPPNVQPATYLGLLQGQLAVSVTGNDGTLRYATGVQDTGVLDDLYAYNGRLGAIFRYPWCEDEFAEFPKEPAGDIRIKVWAPTAQTMKLELFNKETDTTPVKTVTMTEHNGLWVATIDRAYAGRYYLYDETVYAPTQRAIVENLVTDPYSADLALNGAKTRLTDLDSPESKPAGWNEDHAPVIARINDLSIYELHVRDFSVGDSTVPASHRGTYLAFTDANSDGMEHLRRLAQAGLKAVHLLPTFHFNSVNEDKTIWATTPDLRPFAPDSQTQQADVAAVESNDAYNWGYDPDHYLAPEGAYAVNPGDRVREYRRMVMGLHEAGLHVIQDMVFNHTSGFGEASNSILDEVVPNYYNRLDTDGNLLTGSCCADTATEHAMMGKLQQDAVLWNAQQYKIDGFRFDIMSFTFVSNLKAIQQALNKLTLAHDGVDGATEYIYGEGFSFGETANSALGVNAQQSNLYGTGLGSFNDRMRDGVRGGGPFDDERTQGFGTGLFTDPSVFTTQSTTSDAQRATLLQRSDWVRIGLTGNLRDYTFTDYTGKTTTGAGINYEGQPAGYTAVPLESINYVSVHDNQSLFDTVQVKAAEGDSAPTRARRAVLSLSLVELGQGIPFIEGGSDLLRSKDMDQNSYDSGDWFNKIDWSGNGNNWGIGLPIASQNSGQWSFEQPLLANGALKPTAQEILSSSDAFQEFLRIRGSSPLFRLGTEAEIQRQLTFLNTGASQIPGLIVMELGAPASSAGGHVLVVFNATNQEQAFTSAQLAGMPFKLHPVQQASADVIVRTATFDKKKGVASVPALTTAVFVSDN